MLDYDHPKELITPEQIIADARELMPKKAIFSHTHAFTKKVIESYSIQDFDLNVLVQNEPKGNIRTVADETLYKGCDIAGFKAIPLYNLESKELVGYSVLNKGSKSIATVGSGTPVANMRLSTAQVFIATDNFNLFCKLSKLNYTAVFHSQIDQAFKLLDKYFDAYKPRIIATNKQLEHNNDLKIHFDADISHLTDEQIRQALNGKSAEIQPTGGELIPFDTDATDNDILRLANLTELQYEQTRAAEAEHLGIRASILDKLVKAKRKEIAESQQEDDFFDHVQAWHLPVNGGELLSSIEQVIDNHIACEPQTRIAAALWILYTWAIDAMHIAPIACITAPEKRCGKTQLLTLIGELCYKPLSTSNISAPALYRAIEGWKPTLLIDEADTFLKENEDLRGVINSGHSRKNAFVVRCDGDDNKPKRFNVYCAKAISGIGHLPETIKDRSIILELRRKLPSEQKQRLRHADQTEWHNIKSKCLRWVNDNFESIKSTQPQLPEQLHDRAQDNWESLFIIAQLASDEWLAKANHAALLIDGTEVESPSVNEQLLTDIKKIFEQHGYKNMFSAGLIAALNEDEESTWATWNRGKPISQHQLAARLKHFGIKSKKVRVGAEVKSGYELSQFDDAFKRYIPERGIQVVTSLQPMTHNACSEKQNVTPNNDVTFKNPLKPTPHKTCNDVTTQNRVTGSEHHSNGVTTAKKQVKDKVSQPNEVIDTKTIDMFGGGI